jgi:hypothetical protein
MSPFSSFCLSKLERWGEIEVVNLAVAASNVVAPHMVASARNL